MAEIMHRPHGVHCHDQLHLPAEPLTWGYLVSMPNCEDEYSDARGVVLHDHGGSRVVLEYESSGLSVTTIFSLHRISNQ